MTKDKALDIKLFDFELESKHIAQKPIHPKHDAKMLAVNDFDLKDYKVKDLVDILDKNTLIVMNNTKVLPSLLVGKKGLSTISVNLHKKLENTWLAFAKNSKRLKPQDTIIFSDKLSAEVVEKYEYGEVELKFNLQDEDFIKEIISCGNIPLPPYIKRDEKNKEDEKDYQTVFAKHLGAVAAPTAGLHFTEELLEKIKEKGIEIAFVTLHVGAGTFLPVKTDDITKHKMHSEFYSISEESAKIINKHMENNHKILAVGTTSLRALESSVSEDGKVIPCAKSTDIFIYPPYKFKVVNSILTNFHLPKSTLFMLISAFIGLEQAHNAYKYAIKNDYRFFSYGDCTLLELKK